MATKGSAPPDEAPPAYGSQTDGPQHQDAGPANPPNPPAQAHMNAGQQGGYPPYANAGSKPFGPGTPAGGYYQPSPMQYGPPQGGYYGQQQQGYYGQPQQGYYGQQPGYYPPGPYYRPQGQFVNDPRQQQSGTDPLLTALACCCCLDVCLLF